MFSASVSIKSYLILYSTPCISLPRMIYAVTPISSHWTWIIPLLPRCSAGLRAERLEESTTEVLSHSLGLVARLEGLLELGNNSDISLRVETVNADEVKVIQAHTLVLSLQSRVFEEMLRNRNSSTLVLRETAECTAVFDKFIRWEALS